MIKDLPPSEPPWLVASSPASMEALKMASAHPSSALDSPCVSRHTPKDTVSAFRLRRHSSHNEKVDL